MKYFLIVFFSAFMLTVSAQDAVHTFELGDSTFLLDGKPFVMISGELHYPRIPKEAWRHRMQMAKAMGINTIGTYVFWNLHEPEPGQYDFSGNNDIAAFVRIAQEEGLWVVLRPSPYVCAEWEFGGYPYWLQNEEGLKVRSLEPKFINAYKSYINEVAKHLAPLQVNHGGNVLMVQVENEYGFYSNDKLYLAECKRIFEDAGFDGLLYTCDPLGKVKDGHLPSLLPAVNGVATPEEVKKTVQQFHGGKGPYYVAEWYPAWFDWWGTKHHTVPAENYAPKLDALLNEGISVNMYMFHGGTTRGFMNGANDNDKDAFEPQVSSYDYDAPLDEAGNPTEKFIQFRNVISMYVPEGSLPEVPKAKPARAYPIQFSSAQSFFDVLNEPVRSDYPLTFEALHQPYGFVLYRTRLKGGASGILRIKELRDYAIIFVNGKRQAVLDRRMDQDSAQVTLPKGDVTLDILVENLGRINFGPYLLKNKKGITESVSFNNSPLSGWEMFRMPLTDISKIKFSNESNPKDIPVFRKGTLTVDVVADTYLDLQDWGKGVVWVNGHNLGRYWSIGPQQTVYLPAEWLKPGENEIVIFELLKSQSKKLKSIATPILDRVPQVK